jgi:hypothetical protein
MFKGDVLTSIYSFRVYATTVGVILPRKSPRINSSPARAPALLRNRAAMADNHAHMPYPFSKIYRRFLVITSAISLTGSGFTVAHQKATKKTEADQILKCADEVQLEGKLSERTLYGPPGGFGQTPSRDAYEKLFLLDLTSSITVQPLEGATAEKSTCSKTFRHVRQVQLFVAPANSGEAEKMVGKVVVAFGFLDESHLPSQHTDVIMDVESLSAKERVDPPQPETEMPRQ